MSVDIPSATAAAPTSLSPSEIEREYRLLSRRLQQIRRTFDLEAVRRDTLPAEAVVTYYENCHDAYRKYHSAAGAVHMALNDGDRFDPDGYLGQPRRLEALWSAPCHRHVHDVLELAFGQGFNLEYLAARHPGWHLQGLDLTPAHLQIAQRRLAATQLANVSLKLGDFHQLPQADASVDAAFCIEAFCYATDVPRALGEVHRVLRPGGTFTLFDGYLPRAPHQLRPDAALAVEIVAKGMAIEGLQVQDELLVAARGAGFEVQIVDALDASVMPSLRRLEKLTTPFVRWSWFGRRALARRHPARGRNVLAGCLMRGCVALGLIGYRQIVLRRAGP